MYNYDYSAYLNQSQQATSYLSLFGLIKIPLPESIAGIILGLGSIAFIIAGIICLLGLLVFISQIRIVAKSGDKWWKMLIPIYNIFVWHKVIYGDRYAILLWLLLPGVGAYMYSIASTVRLCNSFGKDVDMAMGMLMCPILFYPILAFGKSEYLGPNWTGVI